VLANYAVLEKERLRTGGNKVLVVVSNAKETNKNEIVFESFPSKREIKQIKKEFKKKREAMKRSSVNEANADGFDELDQFFQSLGKSENINQDRKISKKMGINDPSQKQPYKKPNYGNKQDKSAPTDPRNKGFDFEREFRETGTSILHFAMLLYLCGLIDLRCPPDQVSCNSGRRSSHR
jgi:hypothetical protein